MGDNADLDSDGDGVDDDLMLSPTTDEWSNTDGDDLETMPMHSQRTRETTAPTETAGDNEDAFPDGPNEFVDSDGATWATWSCSHSVPTRLPAQTETAGRQLRRLPRGSEEWSDVDEDRW